MQATIQASVGRLKTAFSTVFLTSDGEFKGKFTRGEGFWSTQADEKLQGIFSRLVDERSQRENWYTVTPYISECMCALSNIGFLYVGAKHQSPELLFAGAASFVSHSVPKAWLLTVDKIGVALVLSKLFREYAVITKNPWLLGAVALAGMISATDVYLARTRGHTWSHVVWHLSSAALADIFLRYAK